MSAPQRGQSSLTRPPRDADLDQVHRRRQIVVQGQRDRPATGGGWPSARADGLGVRCLNVKHALYLLDLGREVREGAETAKNDAATATGDDRQFEQGRLMAYYEVVSLMQQQANAFDLPLPDLVLDGINPDRDLIGR